MTLPEIIDQLTRHATLGQAPRHELEWLASHGTLRSMDAGDVLSLKGEPVAGVHIVLSGHFAIFVDRGSGPDKVLEWRGGEVTGLLPYSRMSRPPGDNVAQMPSTVLSIHRDCMLEMIRACHEVTSILVHKMVDRARHFTSSDLHNEKLASLGRLSAGLAHELNNPVAAIERSAALLDDRLEDAERASRALGAAHLTSAQLAAIEAMRVACLASTGTGVLSPLQRADREDAIADWLASHGRDAAVGEALSDTAVTLPALDQLAAVIDGPALDVVLRWAATGCAVRAIGAEIQDAAMRIAGLVAAVKGFTHMDQGMVAGPVDLAPNLGNTVTVLRAKARQKAIAVAVAVEPGLPLVRGFAGELNQIWANLIDNALDAVAESGRVDVTASRDGDRVVVRVIDNGPGIAPEVRDRMFDPFVTTKPVGKGTGLGLDIVRRLVGHNDGRIAVDSRPGRTEFSVSLPLADATAPATPS